MVDQPRVRREDKVGQAGHRLDQIDHDTQLGERLRKACHWALARSGSLPARTFIQGLISYSIP